MLKGLSSFWVWTAAVSLVAWVLLKYAGQRDLSSAETLGLVIVVATVVLCARQLKRVVAKRKGAGHAVPGQKT